MHQVLALSIGATTFIIPLSLRVKTHASPTIEDLSTSQSDFVRKFRFGDTSLIANNWPVVFFECISNLQNRGFIFGVLKLWLRFVVHLGPRRVLFLNPDHHRTVFFCWGWRIMLSHFTCQSSRKLSKGLEGSPFRISLTLVYRTF